LAGVGPVPAVNVAFAGGVDGKVVMGSRSTYLRGSFGGLNGRALRDGDTLRVAAWTPSSALGHWHIDPRVLPVYSPLPTLRVVCGTHVSEYNERWLGSEFKVTPQSDRMGVRLNGPALERNNSRELFSSAVAPGTVQVPPNGQPIILLADAQTIGGYPKLAHVIGVDLPLVAQLRPGNAVRFRKVSLAEAHRLWLERERSLAVLREGLAQKFR